MPLLNQQGVVSVSSAKRHTVALTDSGALWMWGSVAAETYKLPTQVLGEALGGARFVHACATEWYTLAVAVVPEFEG